MCGIQNAQYRCYFQNYNIHTKELIQERPHTNKPSAPTEATALQM